MRAVAYTSLSCCITGQYFTFIMHCARSLLECFLRGRWRYSWHATSNVKATSNMSTTQDSLLIQTRHTSSTRTRWHFAFAVCCHSNATCPPIANPPNSGQLGVTPCHSLSNIRVRAVVGACGRGQAVRHTDRRAWPIYISRCLRFTRNVTNVTINFALISSKQVQYLPTSCSEKLAITSASWMLPVMIASCDAVCPDWFVTDRSAPRNKRVRAQSSCRKKNNTARHRASTSTRWHFAFELRCHSNERERETRVINIHFALSTTHANCN